MKRPGLKNYELMVGTDSCARDILNETLIMEQISKAPTHPNIIRYHGCRVRRGRITGIFVERLELTLRKYPLTPGFHQLDKVKFFNAVKSAVEHLHALGLAHNDISDLNIMVRDGSLVPVLIDLGSCRPFGGKLQSLGSPGWMEEEFFTSEKKHDLYSLTVLQKWLRDPTSCGGGVMSTTKGR